MKLKRLLSAASLAVILGTTAAHAQIAETQPAEFPPASFKGKQYVDSNGCVFIRAGIDGDVSWIPRVTRSRQVICGFTPTLGGRVASAPAAAPAPEVEQITVDTAAAAPAPAPQPAPRRVVRRQAAPAPAPAPRPARRVVRQTAPQPAPAPRPVAIAPAPTPAPTVAPQARVAGTSACPGASAISQRYLRSDGRTPVRCGPQSQPIVASGFAGRTGVAAAGGATISAQTRVVPKHVAINRLNTTDVTVPHGYKRAWEDDRLNSKRAEQTLGGRSDMLLVWTNTVPRRLINQSTGRDVTARTPLVYPFLDVATQRRELGEVQIVQRNGQTVKRILRNPGAARVTYSSRSAPKPQAAAKPAARATPKPKAAATGPARYVQIGHFSTKAKAQQAAARLSSMGMGARMGTVRRGGKTYTVVQAGPFKGNAATDRAVKRLRGIGYTGSVVR
ncbi:MAG: SPOR domain-containing protein [Pseudomonadota bacterium]